MKKIIFRIVSFLLLAILLLVIVVPIVYKGEISDLLKEKLNEQLDATVEFSDVGINLFKDFPNFYVNVKDLSVTGKGPFADKELYNATSTAFSINLKSVIDKNTPYQVNEITLVDPVIDVQVLKDGAANYNIYSGDETTTTSSSQAIDIALSKYEIKNGSIRYLDIPGDIKLVASGVNHSGSGNFTQTVFDITTDNAIDKMSLSLGGVNYASQWSINGDINAAVNLDESSYAFKDNVLRINDMDLKYKGGVKLLDGDRTSIDMDFDAPNNSLKSILSLIPSVYQEDFSSLTASGISNLKGSVHGIYKDGASYPAIDLDVSIKDGAIAYPDLPEKIERLNFTMKVAGKQPSWSDLMVDIPQFVMSMAGEQVTGKFKMDNVMGNKDIAAILDGDINLGMISKFVQVDGLKQLSGQAKTHIELDAAYDDIVNQNYNNVLFDTDIGMNNVVVEYEGFPSMQISDSKISGSPKQLAISQTNIKTGSSDAQLSFSMNDPLKYIVADQEVVAELNVKSNRLNTSDFMVTSSKPKPSEAGVAFVDNSSTDAYIENIKLDYDFSAGQILYEDMELSNVKSAGRFDDETTRIDDLDFKYDGVDFQSDGSLGNVYRYAMYDERADANLNFSAGEIDLNTFNSSSEGNGGSESEMAIILVPDNFDATINTKIKKLIYDDIAINNVNGAIKVKDQTASLVGFQGKTLGGEVRIDGDYNTTDITKPLYNFKYDINIMDFQEAFKASSMFEKLAPFAKFIKGNFNSNSEFSGVLGKDMMPDISTLSAEGFLETLNSVVFDFPVLDNLGNKLGINELKRYEIKDSKNWFTVKDGAVNVEPFSFTQEDMTFNVSGKHFLNQELDYKIKAEIPREKLQESNVTSVVNSGLDWIKTQTSSKGINLDIGDYIYLDIAVTGTLTNPNLKIVPTGSGGQNLKDSVKSQVADEVDKLKDKVMSKTEQEIERRKKEAEARINTEVEKATSQVKDKVNQEVDKAKEQVKEKVKDVVKEQVLDTLSTVIKDKVGDQVKDVIDEKVGEVLGDKADTQIENVKDRLKDIKIFGKNNDDDDGGN